MQNFYLVRILQRHELSKCTLTKCTFSLIYNHVQTPISLLEPHLEVKDFWQKQRFKLFQRFDDQNSRMLVFGSYKRIVIDVWIQKANFEKATLRSKQHLRHQSIFYYKHHTQINCSNQNQNDDLQSPYILEKFARYTFLGYN